MKSELGPQDVHVWYTWARALSCDEVKRAEATLSDEEHARRKRFRFADDQRDYTVAHDLLRRCLSHYTAVAPSDWRFDVGPYGKPYIRADPRDSGSHAHSLHFSLSHAPGIVACAIASGRAVGVDVECVHRVRELTAIADAALSAREIEQLDACPDCLRAMRVLELWTLKEAFVKATGAGFSHTLRSVSFDLARAGAIDFELPHGFEGQCWQFAQFAPAPHTRLAVAVRTAFSENIRFIARSAQPPGGAELVVLRRTI